uniref:Major capsid protein n=1 Tax=Dulem virus 176 TaxID=3145653 RepID=A0AAU8B7E4_9VIRU
MAKKFAQLVNGSENVHFSRAMFGEVESSRMTATPIHTTTLNAGKLIPIYCREILPDETIDMSFDFVLRQTTILTPTMANMVVDFYAFFVPNRIVNESWKTVQGENVSGSWVAPEVSLAPLVSVNDTSISSITVPVQSVADYYGFPTQAPISKSVLRQCHDLKFRGYVMIYNEYFRDQNYQPPIPITYLNVYEGFFSPRDRWLDMVYGSVSASSGNVSTVAGDNDNSVGSGAIKYAIYGSSSYPSGYNILLPRVSLADHFYALGEPLTVNKFHDYFTSGLPSPEKSAQSVEIPVSGASASSVSLPVTTGSVHSVSDTPVHANLISESGEVAADIYTAFFNKSTASGTGAYMSAAYASGVDYGEDMGVAFDNLYAEGSLTVDGLSVSVDDLRMSIAVQQYYETLSRGGSRYRELINSFFSLEVDNPYEDIPTLLGHIRRDLDLYQTAQTSSSQEGSTAQGNLAAFGYTASNSNQFFKRRFVEHGYLHIFCVVRHKNVYSSYLARDNFRLTALDYYTPPFANISEQPIYTRELNPFVSDSDADNIFNYNEAWAEYRFEPDIVSGYMRPGISESLALWNYADNVDTELLTASGNWLKSNSQEVLDRTLAVTSEIAPQFKLQIKFSVDKTLPMPVYSVPGLDIV